MKLRRTIARLAAVVALGVLGMSAPGLAQSWKPAESSRLVGRDREIAVSGGRSLYDIARDYGFALEHLAEANDLPVSLSPVSRSAVVVPSRRILPDQAPEAGLVVNLPERGFYVFRKGEEAKFFPIAIGEPGRFQTPAGRYSIIEKVVDPEWIAPEWAGLGENNVIPAGPDNPLGDRWIGLTSSGLGMHSTNNPSSIGSATSHGCMRMYPEIARKVFDLVEIGWPVTITYETSRVSLEKDGIYAVCFPDPYHRVDRSAQLRDSFRELDLGGFYGLVDANALLATPTGVSVKVVDLEPRVSVGGTDFPAARVAGKVYLEGGSLNSLGVVQKFDLANQKVNLALGPTSHRVDIRLDGSEMARPGDAFLSRGAAWYPAKEVLQALGANYAWDGEANKIRVEVEQAETE